MPSPQQHKPKKNKDPLSQNKHIGIPVVIVICSGVIMPVHFSMDKSLHNDFSLEICLQDYLKEKKKVGKMGKPISITLNCVSM